MAWPRIPRVRCGPSTKTRIGAAAGAVVVMAAVGAAAVLRPPEAYVPHPPQRSALSAPVENRVLDVRVTTRGQVRAESTTSVDCAPIADAAAGSQVRVFTKPIKPGQVIKEGDVLAAVNGRPVIALRGATASFRDIVPAATGADVKELQVALRRLGLPTGSDKDGIYAAGTQAAVEKMFDQRGFRAEGPTREEESRVSAARLAAAQADAGVVQAQAALDAAANTRRADLVNAQIAVKEAAARQDQAVTPAEKEVADLGLHAAQMHLDDVAGRTSATEAEAFSLAKTVSDQAHDELTHLQRTTGISVPFCEVVFLPTLPATVQAPRAAPDGAAGTAGASDASQPWATLTSSNLVLDVELNESDATLVHVGARAGVRLDGAAQDLPATVAEVTPAANRGIVARIRPDTALPPDALDSSVRVAIAVGSSEGKVLVVPMTAVAGAASGDAKVTVVDESGAETPVMVSAGLASEGYVQITPKAVGQIKEGDRVRVGA